MWKRSIGAQSPLQSSAFLDLFTERLSLTPFVVKFPVTLLGPVTISHPLWDLFPSPSKTFVANPVS